MPYVMALKKDRHGTFKLHEPIPPDLWAAAGRKTYTKSLGVKTRAEAKARLADELTVFHTWIAQLREVPKSLTPREIAALVGVWYRDLSAYVDASPSQLATFEHLFAYFDEVSPADALKIPPAQPKVSRTAVERAARELLSSRSLRVPPESVAAVEQGIAGKIDTLIEATWRKFKGDWSADPQLAKFPEWKARTDAPRIPSGRPPDSDFAGLVSRWERHKARPPESVRDFKNRVLAFAKFVGHGRPETVEVDDVVRWRDSLSAVGLKKQTVDQKYLAALAAVYGIGIRQLPRLITVNPVQGARYPRDHGTRFSDSVDVPPYTLEEVQRIFSAARLWKEPEYRWLPFVYAYAGLRLREGAQLRREDVQTQDGIAFVDVHQREGSGARLKNVSSRRDVPVYRALIDEGFVAYVESLPSGAPLFPSAAPKGSAKKMGGRPVERWRAWLRGIAPRPELDPTHSFRHFFMDRLRASCGDSELRERLMGHAVRGEGGRYGFGHGLRAKREAIDAMPPIAL